MNLLITGVDLSDWRWFSAKKRVDESPIQDPIHTATKLRNALFQPSVILPVGPLCVPARGDLVSLIRTVSQDQHELTESLLNPKDKMNYRTAQKVHSEKVTNLLSEHVINSDGTALFLDMIREVTEAFTRPDLTPLQRVKMVWKWVFFSRWWRSWIEEHDGYNLKNNFITSNAYACIELNAHALIQLIIYFRDKEEHHLFLIFLLSSQPCESIFDI